AARIVRIVVGLVDVTIEVPPGIDGLQIAELAVERPRRVLEPILVIGRDEGRVLPRSELLAVGPTGYCVDSPSASMFWKLCVIKAFQSSLICQRTEARMPP